MYTMPMRGEQVIHIDADQETNFDIGPWVVGGQALLTIVVPSGVTVSGTDTSIGAIYSSEDITWERSLVTVRCSGTVLGCNGIGGSGSQGSSYNGNAGGVGGNAIDLDCPIVVYSPGSIQSGGGGGGGGASGTYLASRENGSGGGGFPGGAGATAGSPDGEVGGTAQFGTALGGTGIGTSGGDGGSCLGAGADGEAGENTGNGSGGAGGLAGIGVNSNGHGVTIKSGAANIIGGTA